ncbi:hypothetical protein ACHAXT_008219 [Thalassiosira profunda]
MANGENRAKVKASAEKSAEAVGRGVTAIGKGIANLATGTVDAVLHPTSIPEKLETCFDNVIVKPTLRTVDFLDDTTKSVLEETDRAFNERVKKAQEGARHLKVVFAQPFEDIAGSFVTKKFPKSDADNALIGEALKENFVFAHLTSHKRSQLVDAFEPLIVKHGTNIITEGEDGDYFYVVGSGEVTFKIGGKDVGSAGKGSSFGELALLYNAPRAATCVAKTQCGLFRLDQTTFRRIMAQQIKEMHDEVIAILKKVPYFKDLDEAYLNKVSNNLKVITFQDGEVLASREEDSPKRFFIIKEGTVEVTGLSAGGADYNDISFGAGRFFGEYAIMNNEWKIGKACAKGRVVAYVLDRKKFLLHIGDDFEALLRRTVDKAKLALIPFGKRKGPAENELDLLAGAIKEKKFPKGHVFFTEGQKCVPALYLVRKGKVSIKSSSHPNLKALLGFSLGEGEISMIEKGGYFGNDTLGNNEKGEFGMAQYTVTALEDIEVGVLDLAAIKSVAGQKHEGEKITMEDLEMIRILGAGTFGKVWLVTRKGTKDAYALKVQVKKQLIEFNQDQGVIREKNIMELLDHPFIIKMASHWQDEHKLYMLLKLYQGGELQTVIHTDSRDGVPEWAAKFYAANILEGLSYMHNRHIIYRDLKPENVLLDSDGYTVIVDLGFAKIIKDKTYTFCGTPLYLAPEIIMQKGHDHGADIWSWGVMLYEMIVGMTPFYDGIVDQMGLFKNIVKCRMEFPEGDFMSTYSRDLIKRVLTVNPNDRLGSFARGDKDIKSHPFFETIDWENLAMKNVKVPFTPKVSDPLDGSNFDDYSKLEAKAKKEKVQKLTAAEQKLFNRF